MVFGAVAAVLHYNVLARILSELTTQLFGIPLLCFFGDFGEITPAELAGRAIDTFTAFCELLGIKLKSEKSEFVAIITFRGLEGFPPCVGNNYLLSVSLTEEKASRWATEISSLISKKSIPPPELEKLIGKLGFARTNLFGKFARTQLRPLYKNSTRETTSRSFHKLK